jgi:release factor glutamine methyltransferase
MTVNLLTIKDIRTYLAAELGKIYDEREIRFLTRLIIRKVIDVVGPYHMNETGRELTAEEASRIAAICERLKTGEPYQYVLGETEFCGYTIRVNPSVLIPRPETEFLADLIIRENFRFAGGIIDLATGSGCIAIALAGLLPGSSVTAIDNSAAALETAAGNAVLNGVKVDFIQKDILEPGISFPFKAGIFVSNPPYVRNSEKLFMQRNVLDFEPHEALFVDDSDPLVFYRAVLGIAEDHLLPGGKIYFEINEAMGTKIAELLVSNGYQKTKIIKDLNQKDRIVKGEKNG